jgi:6-phosphogluconolactonase (cycloisomerase 2 family)
LIAATLLASPFAGGTGIAAAAGRSPGAVYVLTNAASGNQVAVFNRAADGTLAAAGTFATGGLGTGGGLGSQGALVLSQDNRWLFAVNAGSNEISVFAVRPDGLAWVDKVASGGVLPISLTVHHDLLYVLNAGGSGNITGFVVAAHGKLSPLAGSTRPLSNGGVGAAPGPAQVEFSPQGDVLVVTEKATNLIDTYAVEDGGLADGPVTHASVGATPFGFAFSRRGQLIVSEAFGGAPGQSALSSYAVSEHDLDVVSASVHTHQTAACWVVVTQNGKYTYTTNAGSGSITGYRLGRDGRLSLLDADGRTGVTGDGSSPNDMALSHNSRYLYALDAGTHAISAFQVQSNGSLAPIAGADGLPAGAVGLAAR